MTELILPARYYRNRTDPEVPCREANFGYAEQRLAIPVAAAALVLVDIWDIGPILSYQERTDAIVAARIVPVLRAARAVGMAVVHAPSPSVARRHYPQSAPPAEAAGPGERAGQDWPPPAFRRREGEAARYERPKEPVQERWREQHMDAMRIVPAVAPVAGDFVVATGDQLHRLLRERRILHLFYVGFAANDCLPMRDYGLYAMRKRGYNLLLLRDCTTAIESHDTVAEELLTRMAIRDFELIEIAWTITAAQFLAACRDVDVPATGAGAD